MTKRDAFDSNDLKAALSSREQVRRLRHHETYAALVRLAARSRSLSGQSTAEIEALIEAAEDEKNAILAKISGKVASRRRPKRPDLTDRETCLVFFDECGSHSLSAKEGFGAFVLSAVIIPASEYDTIDDLWKDWKQQTFGRDAVIHEPDVRRGIGPFWFNGDYKKRQAARTSLAEVLSKLPFIGISCVVLRDKYHDQYGYDPMDPSLPPHIYLMTLDFLMERLVIALDQDFNGAVGRVAAESRGPREDAVLQYEFVRLHLDGTSYISDAWFRQQLIPGIEFKLKKENSTGLQLADLLARPCGEKVLDPASTPERWPELRDKLCKTVGTDHSALGLKVVPWDDSYTDILKS